MKKRAKRRIALLLVVSVIVVALTPFPHKRTEKNVLPQSGHTHAPSETSRSSVTPTTWNTTHPSTFHGSGQASWMLAVGGVFIGPTMFFEVDGQFSFVLRTADQHILSDQDSLNVAARFDSIVTIQCAQTKTFLSRQIVGGVPSVTIDKVFARTSEKWRLKVHQDNEYLLFGVSSQYSPDADSVCIVHAVSGRLLVERRRCTPIKMIKIDDSHLKTLNRSHNEEKLGLSVVMTVKSLGILSRAEYDLQVKLLDQWSFNVGLLANKLHGRSRLVVCLEAKEDLRRISKIGALPHVTLRLDCEYHTKQQRPTYRGLFAKGESDFQALSSASSFFEEYVLMINADVLIDPDEVNIMLGAAHQLSHKLEKHVLITGSRWNCPPELILGNVTLNECQLFQDDAEDYFLVTRGAFRWGAVQRNDMMWDAKDFSTLQGHYNSTSDAVPPMVVGGIAFDNWLVAAAATSSRFVVLDATPTVKAQHFSFSEVKASHRGPASLYNSEVAHYCGGWAMGKLSTQQLTLLPLGTTEAFVHLRGTMYCDALKQRPSEPRTCGQLVQLQRPRGDAFDRPWRG
jgi:hypothetical protein